MIIVMKPDATPEKLRAVIERVESLDLKVHLSQGEGHTIIGVVGLTTGLLPSFTLGCGPFGGTSTTDTGASRSPRDDDGRWEQRM